MSEIIQDNAADAASQGETPVAPARAKKTRRHANLWDLGFSSYGERSRDDSLLLVALVDSHPRQFWEQAKRCLTDRSYDRDWAVLAAFAGRETLIRAGLWLASKSSRIDGVGRNEGLQKMLSLALSLPGKSDAFYLARIESAKARLAQVSASEAFYAIASPAALGNAAATLALAKLMPDANSKDREEARRHTYGETSFGRGRFAERSVENKEIALIKAQAKGKSVEPMDWSKGTRHPLFWIAHRFMAASKAKSPDAALWAEAGEMIIRRCPKMAECERALPLMLAIPQFRKALIEIRPQLGSPSFYCFHRSEALIEAFRLADKKDVAEIIAYANTGDSPKLMVPTDPKSTNLPMWTGSAGLPAWALALLAGKAPDAAWMPVPGSLEALAPMPLPKAQVEKASLGRLRGAELDRYPNERAARYDAAKLCKALGHSWEPPAEAKAEAAESPREKARAPIEEASPAKPATKPRARKP